MVLYWNAPERGRDVSHGWIAAHEPAPTIQAAGAFGVKHGQYGVLAPLHGDDRSPRGGGRVAPEPKGRPPVRKTRNHGKLPYGIPNVADIRELSGSNGLIAVSTFSGCGGSSTGYRMAGWSVPWASEFHPGAADCYEANWPAATVDRRDVRDVTGSEILEACGVDELDMLDGSPPCQPFSGAGKRHKGWRRDTEHADGTTNRGGSENLVGEWVRLVDEIRPRAAVMENVKGLAIGRAKGFLLEVLERLAALGYRAGVRLLDAQWLGVPQRRVRTYVVAFRGDLSLEPVFPEPLPFRYSMADALPWLTGYEHNSGTPAWSHGELDPTREPVPTVTISGNAASWHHKPRGRAVVDARLWGRERTRLNIGEPSPTVVASGAQQNRPEVSEDSNEPRKFTILEVKRLCGFPDDYELRGSYAEQWARLGNSVPPPMACAVGRVVADALLGGET